MGGSSPAHGAAVRYRLCVSGAAECRKFPALQGPGTVIAWVSSVVAHARVRERRGTGNLRPVNRDARLAVASPFSCGLVRASTNTRSGIRVFEAQAGSCHSVRSLAFGRRRACRRLVPRTTGGTTPRTSSDRFLPVPPAQPTPSRRLAPAQNLSPLAFADIRHQRPGHRSHDAGTIPSVPGADSE